jgi:cytochrome c oxidase cbb3-type subunit 3
MSPRARLHCAAPSERSRGKKPAGAILLAAFWGSLFLLQLQIAAQNQNGRKDAGTIAIKGQTLDFPDRPQYPEEVIDRGKTTYGVSCSFCHGSDARGGEVGPNLLRSAVVLQDQNGELISPIIHGGRAQQGMPRVDITDEQIKEVAAWLHHFNATGKTVMYNSAEINILTGNAVAGEAHFQKTCTSCHSATGDLAAIGSRITEPKTLQQTWLLPGGEGGGSGRYSAKALGLHIPPITATVTLPSGKKIEGNLVSISDFYVGLTNETDGPQGFRRDGDLPKVEIHDPLAPHRELVEKIADKDVHDVTAYLVTLK